MDVLPLEADHLSLRRQPKALPVNRLLRRRHRRLRRLGRRDAQCSVDVELVRRRIACEWDRARVESVDRVRVKGMWWACAEEGDGVGGKETG